MLAGRVISNWRCTGDLLPLRSSDVSPTLAAADRRGGCDSELVEGGRFNTAVTNRSGDRATAAAFPAAPRGAGVDRRRPTPGRPLWMPLGTLYTSIHCLHHFLSAG